MMGWRQEVEKLGFKNNFIEVSAEIFLPPASNFKIVSCYTFFLLGLAEQEKRMTGSFICEA